MKTYLYIILALSTASASATTNTPQKGSIVQILVQSPSEVFTPKGFDSDNNAQVVLAGAFSNTCFQAAPPTQKVDVVHHKIYIRNRVYAYDVCVDAMMYIPYSQVIDLGTLPAATYEVLVQDGKGIFIKREELPIAVAKPNKVGTDDFLYASIREATFEPSPNGGNSPTLSLKGFMPTSCMNLGEVQIAIRPGNVVEVLPMTIVQGNNCHVGSSPFDYKVNLQNFPSGVVLIHIRSMNGQAINKVIDVVDRI